jgi:hypothetical protein
MADTQTFKVEKEHRWLQQLVGEWTFETEFEMEPGKPPEKSSGTESVRSLGDFWVVAEGHGEMPDGEPATTIMTLGYDPRKKRFVGTFVGSMMNYMWVYDGGLDPTEKVLNLDSDGPSMTAEGQMAKYRDTIELKSADERVMRAQVLGDDGKWNQFMTMTLRRK